MVGRVADPAEKSYLFRKPVNFYAPGSNDRGHIVFVLSVCLSVVNFNLRYNF